ncbi:phage tail protein, partial [Escherichia coli]|nr:phage tail protein [Escherichia coli]
NDPNFATTMLNALAGKQPLDNTLTNLSGKDVAGLLAYLGLGEAAKRNVGTGENQIPDMSAFPSGKNWFQLPSGHIVQMFSMNVYGADTNGTTGNFPIAFPSGALAVSALWSDGTLTAAPTFKLMGYTTTRTSVTLKVSTGNGLYGTMIIAIGR